MKKVVINNINYELIEDNKEGYDQTEVESKLTDYFEPYTYIVGDWAYGKLRLKGFYDKNDSRCNKTNNIDDLKKYIENNCAYGCRYFELKKVIEKK